MWLSRTLSAVVLLLPTVALAQIPVTDAGNAALNLITSTQSVITAAESVAQTINMGLELAPLDGIMAAEGMAEDMAALGGIIEDANGLMQDLNALQTLFDVRTAPATLPGLELRMAAMTEALHNARNYALKTQLLIYTLGRTITHLTGLVNGIAELVGNKQGQQHLIQVNVSISKTLAVLTTQTSGAQRVDTLIPMRDEVIRESLARIAAARWEGWPGATGGR